MDENRSLEEIQFTIRIARDSVGVVNDEIEKLNSGEPATKDRHGILDRNVEHLKIIVSNQDVIDSNEDISDLHEAITAGEAKLAENIWPAE